jgi:hypothetical protein
MIEPIEFSDESLNSFIKFGPPSSEKDFKVKLFPGTPFNHRLSQVNFYCDHEKCKREMQFSPGVLGGLLYGDNEFLYFHYTYTCKHCSESMVTIFLGALLLKGSDVLCIRKIGEWPPLAHVPKSKLLSLFGRDKDIYLKGRRCEAEGLGIGAFVYYRRIVEGKKIELFGLIIKALKTSHHKKELIDGFERAGRLNSFKESVDAIKDIFPPELKIHGHNPLTLLFKALSKGVHEMNDVECLENAKDIRVILISLLEKLDQMSKDDADIREAIKKLNQGSKS